MEIRDLKITIATAASAVSTSWKNKALTWGEFVTMMSNARVTNETYREFMSMSKAEQGRVKDVGAFVGGELLSRKRTKASIGERSLIALDIDFGEKDFAEQFAATIQRAFFIHGTHKHNFDKGVYRYRILMPIDRPVDNEEYEALTRKVAELTGMDLYDRTTFQPERCMFFPSVPSDVSYYFEDFTDVYPEVLEVDKYLDMYEDWSDTTEWAYHKDEKGEARNLAKEQQDPTLKSGSIGDFCRAYTISEAIEKYLPEIYTPTDKPDRWTYTGGSTSGGMVTYDDLFAYSHHSTDPIQGNHVFNAYDLVRIHLFGKLDKRADSKVSITEMNRLVYNDEKVKALLAKKNGEEAAETLAEFNVLRVDDTPVVDAEDMGNEPRRLTADEVGEQIAAVTAQLDDDGKGGVANSSKNISIILRKDPLIGKLIARDLFKDRRVVSRTPHWRLKDTSLDFQDVDFAGIRKHIEDIYGVSSVQKVDDAIALEAEFNAFHPIQDYLNGLSWDGIPRVERLLIDYMGAEDCQYSKDAIRVMLVGAVKRVFEKGCKFDTMLVMKSDQGAGKSTLIRMLGKKWFSDSLTSMDGKDAFEQLQGNWLIEVAELSAMRKSEVESIKNFISKTEDSFRPAYGRVTKNFPRQCVFFGTTNKDDFLKDATGNRRFIPVEVKANPRTHELFEPAFENYVDMVWAEAVAMYRAGATTLLSRESEAVAEERRAAHLERSGWHGEVDKYLNMKVPADWGTMSSVERSMYFDNYDEAMTAADYRVMSETSVRAIMAEVCKSNSGDRRLCNEIKDLMLGFKDWELRGMVGNDKTYGKQASYVRKC